jgi:polysaccharide biosynthesis/export protein
MWLRRLLVLFCAALALAACARPALHRTELARSELDARMYGATQPVSYRELPVVHADRSLSYAERPASCTGSCATQAVAVVASLPEGPYTLDSGDRLRIVVFGQDSISNNYTVDAQGAVTLPLIGTVTARGLTTVQLGNTIATRLKQGYIREPNVAVEIETYRPFFVLGEVMFPGQYPYVPNMTAENAVAIAGGFTPRAYHTTITITRKVQGVPTKAKLPLRHPVRPGDIVEISERWF